MSTIKIRENELGNVIRIGHKMCKNSQHGPFLLNANLADIECETCGERLNPMHVLDVLARFETNWERKRLQLQHLIQEASLRNSTKCEKCKCMTRIVKR